MTTQTYYYTAREVSGGWIGIVYYYENSEKEKHVYNSERLHTEEKAKDLAYAEWQNWIQPQGIIKQ